MTPESFSNHACNEARLERMLEDTLAPAELEDLQSHLNDCATCRDMLDRMAVVPGVWDDAGLFLKSDDWDHEWERLGASRASSTADSGETPSAEPRRLIEAVVVSVLLLVLTLAGVLYGRPSLPSEITAPSTSETVSPQFQATGSLASDAPGHVWLAVKHGKSNDELYWPKHDLTEFKGRQWAKTVDEHSRGFHLVLLAVPDDGHRDIEKWIADPSRFPGLPRAQLAGAKELAVIGDLKTE
jgi:hypothetical protein